jgi:uncharacterized protein YoxC
VDQWSGLMSIVIVTGWKLLSKIIANSDFSEVLPGEDPGSGRMWRDTSGALVVGPFTGSGGSPVAWGAVTGDLADQADLAGVLNALDASQDALSESVENVSASVGTVTSDVEALSDDVQSLYGSVGGLSGDIGTLNGSVNSLAGSVNSLGGSLESLSETVSDLSSDVDGISDVVDLLATDVSDLSGTVGSLSGTVSSLTSDVTTVSGLLDLLSTDVTTLSGTVGTLSSDLSTVSGSLGLLTTEVTTLSGTVSTLSGSVASLTTTVTTVSGTVDSLSSDVSTLSGSVSTLSGTVSTLSGTVSSLSSTVSTLSDTVSGKVSAAGDTMSGELIVDRSFVSNQRFVTGKIAGVEHATLRTGTSSSQGGEVYLGNGSDYVMLQYGAGFPKLITSRSNLTLQTSTAQHRFTGGYIDYYVGTTQVFQLQFSASTPVLKLRQSASGQPHLELTNTSGTNEFNVDSGGNTAFNGSLRIGPFTVSAMPAASANTGRLIRLTDRSQKLAYSDGSNWRFVSGDAVVS